VKSEHRTLSTKGERAVARRGCRREGVKTRVRTGYRGKGARKVTYTRPPKRGWSGRGDDGEKRAVGNS